MTKRYQKILLAVDFHSDNSPVIETAKDLRDLYKAELHIVHVNEPLGIAYAADGVSWGDQVYALEKSIRDESKKQLTALGNDLGIAEDHRHMLEGRPASCIHDLCVEGGFNLIVLGTHGQSGLQLLLGSTANSVLHGSKCDVLAIRVDSED